MSQQDQPANDKEKTETPSPEDNLVETKHSIIINGEEIHYTVTTGTFVLKEEDSDREKEAEGFKPKAEIFFIAYTLLRIGQNVR